MWIFKRIETKLFYELRDGWGGVGSKGTGSHRFYDMSGYSYFGVINSIEF